MTSFNNTQLKFNLSKASQFSMKANSAKASSLSSSPTLSTVKSGKNGESTEQYFHIKDLRSQSEKQRQTQEAEQIYHNNLKVLNIEMTPKIKVIYPPSKLIKVDVGNSWYAMITDNQVDAEYTVLTVHGSPGDHREWAGFETQMKGTVRWMNLVIPGFDGLDQRRGNYSGSAEDLGKLIVLVLETRKASKLIYCGHSLGSIFGSYFINKYPQLVHGYINITGIVNQWYTGLMLFYRNTIAAYGFGKGPNQASMLRLLNKNQYRQKHHQRFISDTRDTVFSSKVPFPELTITEMCAYIKLGSSMPRGCSQFYELNQRLRLLRMLIFGKIDPLHEIPKTDEQIYAITRGRFRFDQYPENARLIASMREELEETVWQVHNISIKAQKLQEYFCYHFDETGHNAHKRRPKELSQILRVYITVLKVMQKYKPMTESRL